MDELDTDDDLLDLTEEAATRTIDEAGGEPELSDYEEEDNRTIVKQIVDESNRTGLAESQVVEQRFDDYGMEVPEETRDMIDAAREGELPEPIKDI